MNVNEKIQVFESQLKLLTGIKDNNYAFLEKKIIPAKNSLPENYEYIFSNNQNRLITVVFSPHTERVTSSFRMRNSLNEDSFSVGNWLKYHDKWEGYDKFHIGSYNGNFLEQVTALFLYFTSIFTADDFLPIITGEKWEDVPFDWAGMR